MKKRIIAGTAVAMLAFAATASASSMSGPGGLESCIVLAGGTCIYKPTAPGGFIGVGNFRILVSSSAGTRTLGPSSEPACAQWSPNATGGVVNNVSSVEVDVFDATSLVLAGPLQGLAPCVI